MGKSVNIGSSRGAGGSARGRGRGGRGRGGRGNFKNYKNKWRGKKRGTYDTDNLVFGAFLQKYQTIIQRRGKSRNVSPNVESCRRLWRFK